MIKFDFKTYVKNYIKLSEISSYNTKTLDNYFNDIYCLDINNCIDTFSLKQIFDIKYYIEKTSSILLVIGIGGSYMGSKSIIEALSPYFKIQNKIIYLGNNLSDNYLKETIQYIKDKEIVVNVISKSGNTLEVLETFKIIEKLMKKKYNKDELKKRIIITTDIFSGALKDIALKNEYSIIKINPKIGGRFSIMTPSNLLPMAIFGIDIHKLIEGYKLGIKNKREIFIYTIIRDIFFLKNRLVEAFTIYEPKLYYFTEWLKQLFAETQGKNNKGILPISVVNTRDLHSLGQYLQEGTPIIFETLLLIKSNSKLENLNHKISDMVSLTHFNEHTPSITIEVEKLNEINLGELIYFFIATSILGAKLLNVDPYTQPGVEKYKKLI